MKNEGDTVYKTDGKKSRKKKKGEKKRRRTR
jgi:hypothetical protein